MSLKKNDDIILKIEDMTSEGSSVGHYDSQAVFVLGGVAGDELSAHIIKAKKNYAIGIINEVLKPSDNRIPSDCAVSDRCGGCAFRNMTYEAELRYKYNRVCDAVKRIGDIDAPVRDIIACDDISHYRNKAQYPVSIDNGELTYGFYANKSHRIIACDDCKLQDEAFADCLDAIKLWVRESRVTSYDEVNHKGLLRHIYLRRAVSTGEIMVCLVINGNSVPKKDRLIELLTKNDNVKSICLNVNKDKTNVILGDKTKFIYGSTTICDELLGKKFVISPESFYQVNHNQCEKLYQKAIDYADLKGDEVLVDLYCGIGTIGLSMADKVKKLYSAEITPQAIENAKINAQLNSITNAEFICGDAFKAAQEFKQKGITPDILVLDPPRKGCQKELFDIIEQMSPKRIVYVSCDPATLARDLKILSEKNYNTLELTPVDMFPRTPHVETVCLITKNSNQKDKVT